MSYFDRASLPGDAHGEGRVAMGRARAVPAASREVMALAVGFWSIYVCQYWVGIQTALVPELWGWLNGYGFKAITLVAIGVVLGVCRLLPRKMMVVLNVASACCAEAGVLLLSGLLHVNAGPGVVLVASTLAEVGLAWMIAGWGVRNASIPLRKAFLAFVLGALAVSLSKILLAFLPPAASSALMLLVVPCSVAMMARAPEQRVACEEDAESTASDRDLGMTFLSLACVATVFFLVWSYLNVTSKFEVGHYGYGVTSLPLTVAVSQVMAIVFFVAAYCWSFVLRHDVDLEGLWRMAFLWLAAAVAASAMLDFSLLSQAFVSSAFEFAYFLLYLSITAYCHHTKMHAGAVAALGNLPLVAMQWGVRALLSVTGVIALDVGAASVVFVALLATVVVLLPGRSPDAQLMATGLNGAVRDRGIRDADERLEQLAALYGLTDRETEVVRHFCSGHTKRYVAETMCLSENTIRTYSRRAYQKLGVHSRGELQDRVWGDGGQSDL